jgi:hypothetical protein
MFTTSKGIGSRFRAAPWLGTDEKARTSRRIIGDTAVKAAVEALIERIHESTKLIGRQPQDSYGRVRIYGVDREESKGFRKEAETFEAAAFRELTKGKVRSLTRTIRKHPAAAWRLSAPPYATSGRLSSLIAGEEEDARPKVKGAAMIASSLFTKIRAALVASGRSERTASRKARLLSSASYLDFVRLTPEQNVKLGLSRGARHYALKGTHITKATPTISARQLESKRARELFGLTPEKATAARRHGAISYVSADQRERVGKAAITREETRVISEIKKLRASGDTVPSNSPDKRRHGSSYLVSEHSERRYRALRRRKLAER